MGATYRYTEIDMKRHFIVCACAVGLMSTLPACAGSLTYSAEPIHAQVIDADTQQPIKGVVVTANWQLEEGTFGGNVPAGQLMVMESVTDNEGKFSFPAWGPKKAVKGHLVSDDPQLLLFKSGYEYQRLNNPYSSDREMRLRPVRRSVWNGRVIALKPFKGTGEEYALHVYDLSRSIDGILDFARGDKECSWKKVPRMLVALHNTSLYFEKQNIQLFGAHVLRIEDIPVNPQCGLPKEILRSYLSSFHTYASSTSARWSG